MNLPVRGRKASVISDEDTRIAKVLVLSVHQGSLCTAPYNETHCNHCRGDYGARLLAPQCG